MAAIVAEQQSSVLAGDSGDGGRQLQQDGGGEARLSAVGHLRGQQCRVGGPCTELDSNYVIFLFNLFFLVLFGLICINRS